MILINGTIDLDPAKRDAAIAAAIELMAATRQEEGCLQYAFTADVEDPGRLHVSERWASAEANAAHAKSDHLATFMGRLGEFGVKGADLRRWESDEGQSLF